MHNEGCRYDFVVLGTHFYLRDVGKLRCISCGTCTHRGEHSKFVRRNISKIGRVELHSSGIGRVFRRLMRRCDLVRMRRWMLEDRCKQGRKVARRGSATAVIYGGARLTRCDIDHHLRWQSTRRFVSPRPSLCLELC